MVTGVLASLAELELELGRELCTTAREARRARGQSTAKGVGEKNAALAERMRVSGESASTIAATLNVSRATVYRVLSDQAG